VTSSDVCIEFSFTIIMKALDMMAEQTIPRCYFLQVSLMVFAQHIRLNIIHVLPFSLDVQLESKHLV